MITVPYKEDEQDEEEENRKGDGKSQYRSGGAGG